MLYLLCSLSLAAQWQEIENPRPHNRWISDQAHLLDAESEAALDARLEALHQDTDAEVVVVTVSSTVDGSPKELATALANGWGVGDAEANNGLLILLSLGDRRLEMETGYGLEAILTDGWLGAMQQREMVPHFKAGDFAAGLVAGVDAVDTQLRRDPEAVKAGAAAPAFVAEDAHGHREHQGSQSTETLGLALAGGAGLVLLGGGGFWIRRRRRTCFEHETPVLMELINEVDDDEHLTEGEVLEEELGSVQHDVYICPECQAIKRFSRSILFSGYERCPQCAHRTASSVRTVLEAPTYTSSGLAEIETDCMHCDYQGSRMVTLPRKQRTTTNSSSGGFGGSGGGFSGGGGGGGSFGGGRSGGGGAGSSW